MSFTAVHQATPRLHRSELAVPGSESALFDKAARSAADVVFLDLEDAVAPDDKVEARRNVIAALIWNWGDARPVAQHSHRTGFLMQGASAVEAAHVNAGNGWRLLLDPAFAPIARTIGNLFDLAADGGGGSVDGDETVQVMLLGVPLGAWASRLVASRLYQVRQFDPSAIAAVALVMLVVMEIHKALRWAWS